MKNPNGYGSIYKLSGRRRKPFAAIVTEGWTDDGTQKRRYIGYYATRREALDALAQYSLSPEEFAEKVTFREVYEGWYKDKFYGPDVREDTANNYIRAYKQAEPLHNKAFTKIKLAELQAFTDGLANYNQAYRFKSLVSQMSDWAILREYAIRNYAEGIEIKQTYEKKSRSSFTQEEIDKVFSIDTPAAKITQILLYTGCRCMELLSLKRENCHIDEHYIEIIAGKTENAARIIPIHDKIYPTIKEFYEQGRPFVFTTPTGIPFTYDNWSHLYFNPMKKDLGIKRTSHECRHTFASLCAVNGVNPTMTKKILGHASAESLTERVYTHISIEDLLKEINKIP